jgi:tetratricopeptide (TPR) repeat protein
MRISKRVIFLSAALGLSAAAGCAATHESASGISAVPRAQADQMTAQHARFENARDPRLTAQTHFAAGRLAESQGVTRQAIVQYKHAVSIDPRHLPSLYRLGVLYTQVNAYSDAIHAWNKYLTGTANDATAWSNLGYCYELAGQPARAEEAYLRGIEMDPKNAPCRINYGLMLTRLGREREAVAHLRAVLPPAQVHYNIASVFEQQGRKDEAKEHYWRALDWDQNLLAARERLSALK